jgi:phosphoserine phosphatase RsbU/P
MPEARFAVWIKQFHGAGGDFYDVIRVGDHLVDYVVADVSGHNLETSLWTTAMKTLLHEHALPLFEPSDILRTINRSLCRVVPEGLFFTVLYARLNRQNGCLTLVNGGHPPVIYLPNGRQPSVVQQTGDVIGAFTSADFDTTEVTMQQGDRFFLYTDGLVEAGGNLELGMAELMDLFLVHREESLEAMVELVMVDMLTQKQARDDIVLMGVEL